MKWFKKTENIKPASHAFIFYFSGSTVGRYMTLQPQAKPDLKKPILFWEVLFFPGQKRQPGVIQKNKFFYTLR